MRVKCWRDVVLLSLVSMLAGCGVSSPTRAASTTPSPTLSHTPTPVPTVDPALAAAQRCGGDDSKRRFFTSGPVSQVGDLVLSQPRLGGLDYPGLKLPDGMPPGQPFQLPGPQGTNPSQRVAPGLA